MNDYSVSDYVIFSDGINTTKTYNNQIDSLQTDLSNSKIKIADQSIFMGPIQENCLEEFETLDTSMTTMSQNLSTISSYLSEICNAYQTGDKKASQTVLKETQNSDGTITLSTTTRNSNLIYSDSSGYVFPFAQGVSAPVSSHVGYRNAPTAGASTNHKGTDIGVSYGTEIHAIASGTVINAGRSNAGGYGNWVQIRQDDGCVVDYGHVSKSDYYSVGDRVEAGDVIANVGSEGVSTGPHLHLQISDANGNLLDSEDLFADCWPS